MSVEDIEHLDKYGDLLGWSRSRAIREHVDAMRRIAEYVRPFEVYDLEDGKVITTYNDDGVDRDVVEHTAEEFLATIITELKRGVVAFKPEVRDI